jgi:hypothetical protein
LASGAEKICGAPRFSADAGALGGTFVAVEANSGEMKVHAGIKSWEKAEHKDGGVKAPLQSQKLGEINLSFGFDDEEGVGIGAAGGAEFFAGIVE